MFAFVKCQSNPVGDVEMFNSSANSKGGQSHQQRVLEFGMMYYDKTPGRGGNLDIRLGLWFRGGVLRETA